MPSHNLHIKWSKILAGVARPEVDKFLDEFVKEVDTGVLRQCIDKCREELTKFRIDEVEQLITYYEDVLGVDARRYTYGLVFYTYLDVDTQVKLAQAQMRVHDSWKFFDYCVVLEYVERKFGQEGAKVALIHIVLDEVARLARIDYTDARRGVEILCNMISLLGKDYLNEVVHRIRQHLQTIILDVAFCTGVNFRSRRVSCIKILTTEAADAQELADRVSTYVKNVAVLCADSMSYEESHRLYTELRELERKLRIRTSIKFDKITGRIVVDEPHIVVYYQPSHVVVYPHRVEVYPVGEITIKVEDYLQDLAGFWGVMRPGSMTR